MKQTYLVVFADPQIATLSGFKVLTIRDHYPAILCTSVQRMDSGFLELVPAEENREQSEVKALCVHPHQVLSMLVYAPQRKIGFQAG